MNQRIHYFTYFLTFGLGEQLSGKSFSQDARGPKFHLQHTEQVLKATLALISLFMPLNFVDNPNCIY